MRTLKLTLAYDGSAYVGWQRQDNGRSIQGELEAALHDIEERPISVVGAGRTDAGVHALGQVASLEIAHAIEPPALLRALNAKLPDDIRVLQTDVAPREFHARYSAAEKTYRYYVSTGAIAPPFSLRYAWHLPVPLDLGVMRDAAQQLGGRHDFSAFQAVGSAVETTVRTIASVTVSLQPAWAPWDAAQTTSTAIVAIEVTADGFLRHMVRTIVGTLVEVGRGRRAAGDIVRILASKRRARAGATAPARGLYLVRVAYRNP